ncbi:complement C3 [Chanos chanos]|uniref:Complement C3 n=1 Tax=Chanos chanos TaxID=29144 RepID=A0A6J2VW66_CHACN|nr:complement C3-like [Chanos chanos]
MRMDLVWLAVVSLSLPLVSECAPLYIMSAPNVLRVGTTERVFVEAQDYSGKNFDVQIRVLSFPREDRELFRTTVTLSAANSFQFLKDIEIRQIPDVFKDDSEMQQFVVLKAQFPEKTLEKIVLVSFQIGYLFVQTDKTLYTPDSTVKYRVFALNAGLQPVDNTVYVEIETPEGIMVKKDLFRPNNGITIGEHKLGNPVSFGIWKIFTRFQSAPQKNFSTEFEVKEYVLPSFEVKLKPEKNFFSIKDKEFKVDIEARYLFDKEVSGMAYVVFGVLKEGVKSALPSSLRRVEISKGEGVATLKREDITEVFPKIDELDKHSLYVSVSVLTDLGSEMVEAQRGGIHIVSSPYTIHFRKTPQYFKPGMPFDVMVYVTNPDETPAKRVEVEVNPGPVRGRTGENGMAQFKVNNQKGSKTLTITAKTDDPNLDDDKQAKGQMTAHAYSPPADSGNYLHISINSAGLVKQQSFTANLNWGENPKVQNLHITYMVLSKGQILDVGRVPITTQSMWALSLNVTQEMIPSFRLVAYYHMGTSEVVSDSVWVDVQDTCMGTLEVKVTRPKATYAPGKSFELVMTGDPGARVGLVAVDKGVYVLNNKNRLTQTKIWDIIEKNDIGCTAGSGKDSMGVFYDAGLLFDSNTAGSTVPRREHGCPSPASRRRRDITIMEYKKTLFEKYKGLQRECCMDGMVENILGYACERRAEYIEDGQECVEAFLHCCTQLANKKKDAVVGELFLARSEIEDVDLELLEYIVTRSVFPESWLWDFSVVPECPSGKLCNTESVKRHEVLPDSITTWVITAIGLSKTHGICVADPYEMIVSKNFFIDLKLPFSAVRSEQLEIKVIVYNYMEDDMDQVFVEIFENPEICSSATKKKKYRTRVSVNSMTSRAVPFVIIPMDVGEFSIEVRAFTPDGIGDHVRRPLKVVTEGVLTRARDLSRLLEPAKHGGIQRTEFESIELPNQVPGTPAHTYIAIKGKPLMYMVEKSISGKGMGDLIRQPGGCAEQNMMSMVLPLIATHYLDNTNQWHQVGVDRRPTALSYISMGYQKQLTYRTAHGSSVSFRSNSGTGSTWMTAYAAKMFTIASQLVQIQENVICESFKWLILNAQLPDGVYKESARAYASSLKGEEIEVSMTAFVLIAMQEGKSLCENTLSSMPESMKRSADYLERVIQSVKTPYAAAIASYALANEHKLNTDVLFRHASPDGSHWPVANDDSLTLEATGYALLALVRAEKFKQATPVVSWLRTKQSYSGRFGATQATVVVFQALVEYFTKVSDTQEMNLNVEVKASSRSSLINWKFTTGTGALQRSEKLQPRDRLTVKASGTGEATVSILTLYYAKPDKKKSDCKNFDLKVTLDKEPEVSYQGAQESYKLTTETKFLPTNRTAAMSILDITIPTGFVVDQTDLDKLISGKDRYIKKYEMDKLLSDRGSLIIYLDKISNRNYEKIAFRMHSMMNVGMPQPAGVTVYEYYTPENRCVKYYSTEEDGETLRQICFGDLCRCAQGDCTKPKVNPVPDEKQRRDSACDRTDYVFKATFDEKELSRLGDSYNFTIDTVLKEGTDIVVEGQTRVYTAHPSCRDSLNLAKGQSYLIMGKFSDLEKLHGRYQYGFGEETWLEHWPTQRESQENPTHRRRYIGMMDLVSYLQKPGCLT